MNYIYLNKELRMPLYKQIHQSIRNAILSGELENNAALPFEEEIAEFYNVSRIAVRMAYEALANEGLIVRIKRRGTFVSKRPILSFKDHDIVRIKRLIESLGYSYSQRNLLIETIKSDYAQFPEILKPIRNEALRITQLIQIDRMPFAIVEYFIPHDVNLYQSETILHSEDTFMAIDKVLQLKLKKAQILYRGEKVRDIYAKSLGIEPSASVIHYTINYKDDQDHIQLYSSIVINGNTNIHTYTFEVQT
ncbi:MAG TPA: GntR family transcriptional regulator [Erysipelotrichaceae bacterium]|nr:GntR family transcriptional regulator [Erysipelotrichaceae bacterium]